jgi:glycosyltransferase involved in cell wall biosynthesis
LAVTAVRSLSVVLPAYNEQDALPRTVEGFAAALAQLVPEWEIVVADDGSRDRTPSVCADLQERMSGRFRFVRLEPNQGYGAALAAGIDAARGAWILLSDADGQFDPAQLGLLLPHAGSGPFVMGYRKRRAEGRGREITSHAFNLLARTTFGLRVRDIDCAFKLIEAKSLKSVRLTCRRYLVNAEILHAFARSGIDPIEVGVDHLPRSAGASKIGLHDVPRTLLEIAKLRVRLWRTPAPRVAPARSAS